MKTAMNNSARENFTEPVHVVGGGLAGSEAAWQLAQAGVRVICHEMRPVRGTDAHQTDALAELVCSNSLPAPMLLAFCMRKCAAAAR